LTVGIVSLHLGCGAFAPAFDMRISEASASERRTQRVLTTRAKRNRAIREFREMTLCVTEDHVTEAARSCPHI
jgi:hypothetical protein